MLESVAPRPWARRMLGWHILETTGSLEFTSGAIIEKIAAFDLLEWAEEQKTTLPTYGDLIEPDLIRRASLLKPGEDIEIYRTEAGEEPITLPVEVAIWLEEFDWETGRAKGSLRDAVLFWPEAFDELATQHKKSWIEVDVEGLRFELSMIEMLAPNAPRPAIGLISFKPKVTKKPRAGGPGRRRKHDWDGALLNLIGEAERNEIVPDPEAHGAQADVAKRMAEWFTSQGADIPSNSQLQTMARRVLDNVRAANPRVDQ